MDPFVTLMAIVMMGVMNMIPSGACLIIVLIDGKARRTLAEEEEKAKAQKEQDTESIAYWQKKRIEARLELAESEEHLGRLLKKQQAEEEKASQQPKLKEKS